MKLMGHSTITVSQKSVHPLTDVMKAAIRGMSEAVLPKVSSKVQEIAKRISAVSV
jgi:5,10-methenyltetrahydromethanopterin hydrogenase